jgi:hypothetical protein
VVAERAENSVAQAQEAARAADERDVVDYVGKTVFL